MTRLSDIHLRKSAQEISKILGGKQTQFSMNPILRVVFYSTFIQWFNSIGRAESKTGQAEAVIKELTPKMEYPKQDSQNKNYCINIDHVYSLPDSSVGFVYAPKALLVCTLQLCLLLAM